jgi:hypothetical protein
MAEDLMSKLATKWQNRVRVGFQELRKVKEKTKMRFGVRITEVKSWVSRGAGAITAGSAIRGLAVGVLLMAGIGMYLGMADGHGEGNPSIGEINGGDESFEQSHLPRAGRLDDQKTAGLEANSDEYHSFRPDYSDEGGNPNYSQREAILEWHRSHLPGMDRLDDLIAAELETCDKVYRSILPEPGDEVSTPGYSEQVVLEWRLSHLPGIDRLDDLIAAELETCDEVYRSILAN